MNHLLKSKNIFHFPGANLITLFALLVSSLLITSCKDDDDEAPTPAITAIDPSSAPTNTTVTITGKSFSSGATVKFGAQTATVTSVNGTQIITSVPDDLAVGSTTVTVTVGNKTSAPFSFNVIEEPIPVISSITPASAAKGAQVTIAGTNFAEGAIVKFGNETATVTSATATQIVTTVPATATTGTTAVTVTVGNYTSGSFNFSVLADPPSITSFTPAEGAAGTTVTITGTNFSDTDAENVVKFGNMPASVTSATPTQIIVIAPQGISAGVVSLSVTVNNQTVTASQQFTVTANPIKSLYWAQLDGNDNYNIVKGYKNTNGEMVVQKLYNAGVYLMSIARRKGSSDLYWAEQTADFSGSVIYKGDTLGSASITIFESLDFSTYVDKIAIGNEKLYWTQIGYDENFNTISTIWSAGLDGSNPGKLYTTDKQITAFTVNASNGEFFFAEDHSDPVKANRSIIYKATADGQTVSEVFSEASLPSGELAAVVFVGLATDGTTLYVAKQNNPAAESEILKVSTQGGNFTNLYTSIPVNPSTDPLRALSGITLDTETSYLYWINNGSQIGAVSEDGSIYRAKATGSGTPERLFNNIKTNSSSTNGGIQSGRMKKKKSTAASFSF